MNHPGGALVLYAPDDDIAMRTGQTRAIPPVSPHSADLGERSMPVCGNRSGVWDAQTTRNPLLLFRLSG